jgi:hypothetical protein
LEPPALQLRFRPEIGDAFDVQVTSVWLDAARLKETTPAFLKELTTKRAAGLLSQAVEKEAHLNQLTGAESKGFYFSLTDKAPEPGDYKYMSEGCFVTGEVMTVFTMLYRDATCPDCEQVLRMFSEAKSAKRKARSE